MTRAWVWRPRVERLTALLAAGALVVAGFAGGRADAASPPPRHVVGSVRPAPGVDATTALAPSARPPSPRHPLCVTGLPRAGKDRPDVVEGLQIHVVYLVAADAPDETLDSRGVIDCSLRAQNDWFQEQSAGLRWRFDSFRTLATNAATGKRSSEVVADVSFVRSRRPMAELSNVNAVQGELTERGFDEPDKRYLTFVAGGADGGTCGDALLPLSPSGPVDGKYAQVYLFAPEACRTHEFGTPGDASFAEMVAQQEIIHNDGIVSAGAPHGCPLGVPPGVGHVCTGALAATEGGLNLDPERVDVMYPFVSVPLSEKVLDLGGDDYFNALLPTLRNLSRSEYLERA